MNAKSSEYFRLKVSVKKRKTSYIMLTLRFIQIFLPTVFSVLMDNSVKQNLKYDIVYPSDQHLKFV